MSTPENSHTSYSKLLRKNDNYEAPKEEQTTHEAAFMQDELPAEAPT